MPRYNEIHVAIPDSQSIDVSISIFLRRLCYFVVELETVAPLVAYCSYCAVDISCICIRNVHATPSRIRDFFARTAMIAE